jgi:hypothetical protein
VGSGSFPIHGDGTIEYGVVKVTISGAKTVGAGACSGCATSACITLNLIRFEPSAVTAPFVNFVQPTTPGSNTVSWQTTAPLCLGVTAIPMHTWGALKALYR